MDTENSNISRAEEVKVLANEAFKGINVSVICFLIVCGIKMKVCIAAMHGPLNIFVFIKNK
jgi:hypothetical protein